MDGLGASAPELLWIFLLFFTALLASAAALDDVTMGAAASAVAYMASVKSRIADLLIRLSRYGSAILCGGLTDVTPRRNKHSRERRTNL
jgi:hypothetical protein